MSLSSKSKTIDKSLSTSTPSNSSSTSSNLYRNLIWSGSIPICITISTKDLPSNADLTIIDSYYLQLPRISYLPLYLNQIRKYFLDLVLGESSNAALNDDEIWFEFNGIPLKWHWPIGLLYDYHTSHTSLSSSSSSSTAPLSPVTSPKALTLPLFPSTTNYFSTSPTTLSSSTFASTSTSTFPSSNLNLNSSTGGSARPMGNEGGAMEGPIPWKITMHLKDSPQDTLLLGPSVEGCKGCFMNMIKEADFVRWGSVKRVTNLRKEQQDSLWEGLVANDFEKFWTVASKLIPLPNPLNNATDTFRNSLPMESRDRSSSGSATSLPSNSNTNTNGSSTGGGNELMRSIPMRIYLPEGAPVIQNVVPPSIDGQPTTLQSHFASILPLLFPLYEPPLALPLIHGILVPLETELQWLSGNLVGADGWLAVVLVLGR